jgi:hypothetical protein
VVIILQLFCTGEQSEVIDLIRDHHEALEEHFLENPNEKQSIVMVI